MLSVPLKGTFPVSFNEKLSIYIQQNYQQKAEAYSGALRALGELRKECCVNAIASSELLAKLAQYFAQVSKLGTRFPFGSEGIKLTFSWHSLGGRNGKPVTSHDVNFEEAAVLFNMGACYSELGRQEGIGSVEGLKRACNYFALAAGVFEEVAKRYSGLQLPPGTDLAEPVLRALSGLMVAQAQECFVLKAILDKSVKDTTLAKLAMATAVLYESVISGCRDALLSPLFLGPVIAKTAFYKATAHYRKSAEFLIASQYGREVVKLQEADEDAKKAKDLAKNLSSDLSNQINALVVTVSKNLERATKDNSIIYHDPVPARGSWGDCGTAVVARAVAFPDAQIRGELEAEFLFERLPRMHVNKLVNELLVDRDALLVEPARELDAALHSIDELFARLGLPGAVQAIAEPEGVPDGLQAKSLEMQAVGGLMAIEQGRQTVAKLRSECVGAAQHCLVTLNEEEEQDRAARQQHGARWTRPPSLQLTVLLRQRLDELQGALKQSERNDAALDDLYNLHIPMILSLCSSSQELAATIPNASEYNRPISPTLLGEVSSAVAQREEFQRRRQQIVDDLTAAVNSVDLAEQVYAMEGHPAVRETLSSKMRQAIGPMKELVEQYKLDVSQYERQIERLMSDFCAAQQSLQSAGAERRMVLQALDEAYSAFKLMMTQMQAGSAFYTGLLEQLHPLKNVCVDFATNRRNEYQTLMSSLSGVAAAGSGERFGAGSGVGFSTRSGEGFSTRSGEGFGAGSSEGFGTRSSAGPHYPPAASPPTSGNYQYHPAPPPHYSAYPSVAGHPPRPGVWDPSMPLQYAPSNVSPASYAAPSSPSHPNGYFPSQYRPPQ